MDSTLNGVDFAYYKKEEFVLLVNLTFVELVS